MQLIVLVFLVAAARKLDASGIHCEKIENFAESKSCCYLNFTTSISAINVILTDPENRDVDALLFANNKKIQFLPVAVHKKFPKLEFYWAKNASVKEISVTNFESLINLKSIDLRDNQIEAILNNCFEDLFKLLEVNLGRDFRLLILFCLSADESWEVFKKLT